MNNISSLECVVIQHESEHYIVPLVAIMEIFPISHTEIFLSDVQEKKEVHKILWNNYEVPLITFSFCPFQIEETLRAKIVIMNGIFSENFTKSAYFGIYFNGNVKKKTLSSKKISWSNESQKQAKLQDKHHAQIVTIFDLFQASKKLEELSMQEE